MKKKNVCMVVAMALVICMVFVMAGCANNSETGGKTEPSQTVGNTTETTEATETQATQETTAATEDTEAAEETVEETEPEGDFDFSSDLEERPDEETEEEPTENQGEENDE